MNALRRIGWFLGTRARWRRRRPAAGRTAQRGPVPWSNAVILDEVQVWDAEEMAPVKKAWMEAHDLQFTRQYLNQWVDGTPTEEKL